VYHGSLALSVGDHDPCTIPEMSQVLQRLRDHRFTGGSRHERFVGLGHVMQRWRPAAATAGTSRLTSSPGSAGDRHPGRNWLNWGMASQSSSRKLCPTGDDFEQHSRRADHPPAL
jgi:hypothetical protein